jgi:antitoxin (DNA-binding transcriptional repressor) of toxin-antitoxin stability system
METEKIGIREFRENLAGYLESGKPLAITRHGETLGFFIPAQKRNRKAEVEAMRAAAKELDAMIAAWGASEDELMREYKEIRRAGREKKRYTNASSSCAWCARSARAGSVPLGHH